MNINALPDLVLRSIFANLPLRDLLRIDLVCSQWAALQPSVCATIRKVVLLVGDDALNLLNETKFTLPHLSDVEGEADASKADPPLTAESWYVLDFDWLDKISAAFLSRLLPNIADAQLSIRGVQPTVCIGEKSWGIKSVVLEQVITLLNTWSKSLVSLKLCLSLTDYYQQEYLERDMPKLLTAFNGLHSLKHLSLELQNSFFYESEKKPLEMPFLERLETFYLDMMDSTDLAYPSLTKYAQANPALREIGFSNIYDSDLSNEFFTRPNVTDFYAKFRQFPSLEFSEPTESMRLFCERFCSLAKISLQINSLPMIYKLARHLRPLKELVYLDLNISFDEERGIAAWDAEQELEMVRAPPVLPSVKVINIYAPLQRHTDLYEIQWQVMLPNLEVIHYNDGWADCNICLPREEDHEDEREGEDEPEAEQDGPAPNAAPDEPQVDGAAVAAEPAEAANLNAHQVQDFDVVIQIAAAEIPALELNSDDEYESAEDDEVADESLAVGQNLNDIIRELIFDIVAENNEDNAAPVMPAHPIEQPAAAAAVEANEQNETEDNPVPDAAADDADDTDGDDDDDLNEESDQEEEDEDSEAEDSGPLHLFWLFGEENVNEAPEIDAEREEEIDREDKIREKCLKLCLQPWRHCPKLKKVYTGDSDEPKQWKLEDLWKTEEEKED